MFGNRKLAGSHSAKYLMDLQFGMNTTSHSCNKNSFLRHTPGMCSRCLTRLPNSHLMIQLFSYLGLIPC